MRIAFIGAGAMGEAMIKRLVAKKVARPQDIVASDYSAARRELMGREYGIATFGDNAEAIAKTDLIVLAVKPQNLPQVMKDIKSRASKQLVISIVAGAKLSSLRQGLDHSLIVRAMPNMPAQIGEGMVVWTATAEVGQRQKKSAQTVLGSLGREIHVDDEKYLSMATALSGSGPAYVFLFIETLIDAGVHIGMPRDMAQKLVMQTVLGSALTLEKTGRHPADLRNMVTSPAGTTTEALFQLEKEGFRSSILEAVAAAYERAEHF
jgi:pyrroline-5-carboxylate reductase